eukprot:3573838-Amphidinium_carterae.1
MAQREQRLHDVVIWVAELLTCSETRKVQTQVGQSCSSTIDSAPKRFHGFTSEFLALRGTYRQHLQICPQLWSELAETRVRQIRRANVKLELLRAPLQ